MAGYCQVGDLLIDPNFGLPAGISKQGYVDTTYEEINARIGRLYKTPVVFGTTELQTKYAATISLLKMLNSRLATGRLVMAIAMAHENTAVHAYGKSLVDEVLNYIQEIIDNKIILEGAAANDNSSGDDEFTSPHGEIAQVDPFSLVEAFYVGQQYPGQVIGQIVARNAPVVKTVYVEDERPQIVEEGGQYYIQEDE